MKPLRHPRRYVTMLSDPSAILDLATAARLIGCRAATVYYALARAKGDPFVVRNRTLREYDRPELRDLPAPAPSIDPIAAALARGQSGFVTKTDDRAVRRWACAAKRTASDLAAVLAGKADLTVDHTGTVAVLRRDVEPTSWRKPEEVSL